MLGANISSDKLLSALMLVVSVVLFYAFLCSGCCAHCITCVRATCIAVCTCVAVFPGGSKHTLSVFILLICL
jgi:hypothetical protein